MREFLGVQGRSRGVAGFEGVPGGFRGLTHFQGFQGRFRGLREFQLAKGVFRVVPGAPRWDSRSRGVGATEVGGISGSESRAGLRVGEISGSEAWARAAPPQLQMVADRYGGFFNDLSLSLSLSLSSFSLLKESTPNP